MKLQPRYKPGDKIGGRYQVHQALMGGMGEVYLCLDLEEIQPFALKTFQQRYQTGTQRLRQAFEKEVSTWVALEKHPNIVRCFHLDILLSGQLAGRVKNLDPRPTHVTRNIFHALRFTFQSRS